MPKPKPKPKRSTAVTLPGQPPRLQVGALCWRRTRKGLRFLLITSRDTGRWIIPKGWPMRNRTEAGAAAREAWEEAGLRGEISNDSLGVYTYRKRAPNSVIMSCVVRVYPLEAREMLQKFPETGQRRARWFSREKAARRVAEHELAALIRGFAPDAATRAPAEPEPDPARAVPD
ncbi:MAG: NUDIX hydrolase [Amaricoccus sp.]|uniref:NUDIX hydrolase n=1 Tax=Amaricoccus sp. TaxID=1872485 RepID=UPI0039E721A3